MDYDQILIYVTMGFFLFYLVKSALAKNFWSRIESLLWANLFLVSLSADRIIEVLK